MRDPSTDEYAPQVSPPCVFCQIIAGEAPAHVVREWPDALAIRPLEPVTKEHMLVIPKTHVEELGSDPWIAAMVMHRVADLVASPRRLWDYNIITSAGSAATQTVFHLHVHVVPRKKGDGLLLPWSNQPPSPSPCQGRCEFHGRLWCKETGRSCQEFVDELESRSTAAVVGEPRHSVLTLVDNLEESLAVAKAKAAEAHIREGARSEG